jgi:hypothetical protein
MVLNEAITPARYAKLGRDVVTVVSPANIKILTTGDAGVTVLNDGPAHGKQWTVTVHVEIVETDAP